MRQSTRKDRDLMHMIVIQAVLTIVFSALIAVACSIYSMDQAVAYEVITSVQLGE